MFLGSPGIGPERAGRAIELQELLGDLDEIPFGVDRGAERRFVVVVQLNLGDPFEAVGAQDHRRVDIGGSKCVLPAQASGPEQQVFALQASFRNGVRG